MAAYEDRMKASIHGEMGRAWDAEYFTLSPEAKEKILAALLVEWSRIRGFSEQCNVINMVELHRKEIGEGNLSKHIDTL